jgi:SAM-dependent methyltransferase
MLSRAGSLFGKIKRRVAAHGLMYFLYELAGLINYPRNGFTRYGVDRFMEGIAGEVASGALLLDAGAGHRPYRALFRHTRYQSCDFIPVLEEVGGNTDIDHTFFCDLEQIPKNDNTYDAIVCSQVLEHVKRPDKVIKEFYRILKPSGQLFLTIPQCFGVHMPPHNYFNFLDAGIRFLVEEAGFWVVIIQPLGGIFWLLGKITEKAYGCLLAPISPPFRAVFFPLHLCFRLVICFFFFIVFYLDWLDREKGWTLNYGCSCIKPAAGEKM